MKKIFLTIASIILCINLFAQKEYTISIPTENYSIENKKTTVTPNSQKSLGLIKEVIHYVNLYSSISCMEKLNPILEDALKKEMKKITEETAYILTINYDECIFLKLYPDNRHKDLVGTPCIVKNNTIPDNGQKDLWDAYTTIYHITLYPDITLHPDFPSSTVIKKDENSASKRPLLATYLDDNGKWIAMGPYTHSDSCPTEKKALDELFYGGTGQLTLLCKRGKYNIYVINGKTDNILIDVRYTLNMLGVNDLPE